MDLNIVFIGLIRFPNGAAATKRIRHMVDYFNTRRISSHVLVTYYKGNNAGNPEKGQYGNCSFVDLHVCFSRHRYKEFYDKGCRILKEWFSENKKNILVFPTFLSVTDYPFYRYARKLGYRVVFDKVETSFLSEGIRMPWKARLNVYVSEMLTRRACRNGASCFVISERLWRENEMMFPNMKMALIPNSTPVISRAPKSTFHDPLEILYVGSFGDKDGIRFLIEGFKMARENGCRCRLTLIGKGTSYQMKVLENVRNRSDVEYLGFVEDEELNEKLLSSDILAMTRTNSRFANYGFPFKLSEYLATGNVVIASRVGDVPLYLENRKNAYLVIPESASSICDTIMYIDAHREEALCVAAQGLEVMKRHFSISDVGRKVEDFLNFI